MRLHGVCRMVGIQSGGGAREVVGGGVPYPPGRNGAEHRFVVGVVYVLGLHRHRRLQGRREVRGSIGGVVRRRSVRSPVREMPVKRHVLIVMQWLRGRDRRWKRGARR